MLSTTLVNYETRYGDSDQLTLMLYYPNTIIEKKKFDDGKIYVLSDSITGESFAFAVRSYVFPEGYGFNTIKT